MSLKDIEIGISYISCGEDNIANAFLNPALKQASVYKRSVGFFSSGVFEPIVDGIVSLSRRGGTMRLIASPQLSEDDAQAIALGYEKREHIIESAFSRDFCREIDGLTDEKLKLLVELIANGTLDIKIAVTETDGIYHDKLGILEDSEGNVVVFYGSPNESLSGYKKNYEKIRVIKSWDESSVASIKDEEEEFDSLWQGTNSFVTVLNYSESAKKNIISVINSRNSKGNCSGESKPIKLRKYQEEAIEAWVDNGYKGFYVMATGTGKTWTAIYSAKRLMETVQPTLVICAPYKHLIRQWAEDLQKAFPKAKIILVSSENPGWEAQISQEIIRKRYESDNQIIIVSTIASFKTKRFSLVMEKTDDEKMLIVDEAHRFTDRPDELKKEYQYLLGLSATPYSGLSASKGQELMNWFGGQVYNLPIEVALENRFLVPYNYYPIYVSATEDEENRFKYHTHKVLSCFKNGKCINPDLLVKSLRNRLRIISMSAEKQTQLDYILEQIQDKDHFVVYCGDGKLFDNDTGEELRHISSVKKKLQEHGYKSSQFTATENMMERMQLVDAFNKQEISALAAIRCLDEGINIPSIKSALILSSNDDYREFVQRRGRILRKYDNKTYANIYDVIVLPSTDLQGWAKIEFRRFLEYAKLSMNWSSLEPELNKYLSIYGLELQDIDVYDYDEMEGDVDE